MKILVIGESCIDEFVYGTCDRISPEAPVPVFVPIKTVRSKGMAANVVSNIKALGIKDVTLVTNKKMPTKTRYVEDKSNHMIVRVDIDDLVDENLSFGSMKDFSSFDAIVVSDYDKGYLSIHDLNFISDNHPLTFLDTKKPLGDFAKGFTFIKINEPEYKRSEEYLSKNRKMNNRLIVTHGSKGCEYKGNVYPVEKVDNPSVSGAGDTFLAALVVEYLKSKSIESAIKFANKCSSLVVSKKGVATV